MPTPSEIIDMAASLQNDTAQTQYTDPACLPYLNMALDELQEIFEANNIPVTNEVSIVLTIPIGQTVIGYTTGLPNNLIEIQQLWERSAGTNPWIPMTKKEFLPHYLEGVEYTTFRYWAWINNEIRLFPCNQENDIKMDYIQSIFDTPIDINDVEIDLGIRFKNIKSFLGYKTAALCSMYIGENETRAAALNGQAEQALERSLGISIKGTQSIIARRRPFRASYKMRTVI